MKVVLAVLMTLSMIMAGFSVSSAQPAGMSSIATGMNTAAGWADDDGIPVANVMVTDIHAGLSGADSIRGEEFVSVDFTVENRYSTAIVIRPAGFTLVDAEGTMHDSVQFRSDRETDLFEEEMNLAAGEQVDLTLVYALPEDVDPAVFQWTPGSGLNVIVKLSDSQVVAPGLNSPVSWLNDQGDEIGTLDVIDLDRNWLDADDYDGSDYDMTLLEVRYRFTNQTDSPQVISGSGFTLIDSLGTSISSSGEHRPASDELGLEDEREVAAGESIEFIRIYGLVDGRQLSYLMWSPNQNDTRRTRVAYIVLQENNSLPPTPLATPNR